MRPKALVVEDDNDTRAALVELLEQEGCDVESATDGELAVGMLTRKHYDVVLLDLVLPKISGTDVMEHLLCTQPQVLTTVIVVTGLEVAEIRKLFPSVCDALGKPVMPKRLLRSVRECLGRSDGEESAPGGRARELA
jgi:DNA-binding response OmpR family regulator